MIVRYHWSDQMSWSGDGASCVTVTARLLLCYTAVSVGWMSRWRLDCAGTSNMYTRILRLEWLWVCDCQPASHRRRARAASPRFRRRTSPRKATSGFGAQNFLSRQQDCSYTQNLQIAHPQQLALPRTKTTWVVPGAPKTRDSFIFKGRDVVELLLDPCR